VIPRPAIAILPELERSRCELGQRCVARAGTWLDPSEIDRLRAGPTCRGHRQHVVATLTGLPQSSRQEEPDGSVWMVPTPSAFALARFLGYNFREEACQEALDMCAYLACLLEAT
jgi:hypothetical protein